MGNVADEPFRENAEQSKHGSDEREGFVPTGPNPQLGSNAHSAKVPVIEHSLGQKPSTEYHNTHHQDTPNPSNQMKVGHIPAHNVKVKVTEHSLGQKPSTEYHNTHHQDTPNPSNQMKVGHIPAHSGKVKVTEQNGGEKPNTKNKNNRHQKTPNPTNETNVGQTPGSQKNYHHNRQQKNSSETTIINQKSNPNSKELKAQHPHPHPHPAPRQTVIESTTVRTSTTYQTVIRGPKK